MNDITKEDLNKELEQRRNSELWERGDIEFLLNESQKKIYHNWKANRFKSTTSTVCSSRKLGKSTLGLFIASELCIKNPDTLIGFVAPTVGALSLYIQQLFQTVFASCPPTLRPKLTDTQMVFGNGSKIIFAGLAKGTGSSYETLQSFSFDLVLIDEAGSIKNLDNIVDAILIPTLLARRGHLIMFSTPSREGNNHPFYKYCQKAKVEGTYSEYTIRDSHYPLDIQNKFIDELGGIDSINAKREFFCQWVIDESKQVIPEWASKYKAVTPQPEVYQFYRHYLGLDSGYRDATGIVLFTHYFRENLIQVEGELRFKEKQVRSDIITQAIQAKADALWGKGWKAHRMVGDSADPIFLNELNKYQPFQFFGVRKKSLRAMVNEFRELVNRGQLLVSPECKYLISHLESAIWDEVGEKLDKDQFGTHFDELMALIYAIRNVAWNENPIPPEFKFDPNTMFYPGLDEKTKQVQLEKAFGVHNLFDPMRNLKDLNGSF